MERYGAGRLNMGEVFGENEVNIEDLGMVGREVLLEPSRGWVVVTTSSLKLYSFYELLMIVGAQTRWPDAQFLVNTETRREDPQLKGVAGIVLDKALAVLNPVDGNPHIRFVEFGTLGGEVTFVCPQQQKLLDVFRTDKYALICMDTTHIMQDADGIKQRMLFKPGGGRIDLALEEAREHLRAGGSYLTRTAALVLPGEISKGVMVIIDYDWNTAGVDIEKFGRVLAGSERVVDLPGGLDVLKLVQAGVIRDEKFTVGDFRHLVSGVGPGFLIALGAWRAIESGLVTSKAKIVGPRERGYAIEEEFSGDGGLTFLTYKVDSRMVKGGVLRESRD